MKAVLISIRPKWCEKIASGEKTIEVRKTKPKLETPFKCYIYCTKPEEKLLTILKDGDENYGEVYHGKPVFIKIEKTPVSISWKKKQKVIGEFVCDRIDTLVPATEPYGIYDIDDDYVLQTCLENGNLWDYGHGGTLYGWHISNLKIYDTPRELREFGVNHPFQSWGYVYE